MLYSSLQKLQKLRVNCEITCCEFLMEILNSGLSHSLGDICMLSHTKSCRYTHTSGTTDVSGKVSCVTSEKIKGCLWNTTVCPRRQQSRKSYFSVKVKVKVIRSLTLVSFEKASLVEYACQIWSFCLLRFQSYSDVKVDNRQTNRQDKNNMPPIIRSAGKKYIN